MKVLRFLAVAIVIVGISSLAQAQAFWEGFESYAAGTDLQNVGGWKGWDGTASASAPVSDTYAASGNNSVEIISTADLVHEFDISGGKWVFSAMQYIPSGGSGETYFIILNSYDDGANQDWSIQTLYNLSSGAITTWTGAVDETVVFDQWVQLMYIIDLDNNTVDEYYNGLHIDTRVWDDTGNATIGALDLYANNASSVYYDDILLQTYTEYASKAGVPSPADKSTNVATNVVLSWTPGEDITTHDVYFGATFADVNAATRSNPMDVLVGQGQSSATLDPEGLLEFSQTYYWRVDEVGTDGTIYPGPVWSFTVEPYMYAIENVTATSNTEAVDGAGPENTVNGSGLDADDLHSRLDADMWLGAAGEDPVYIQFDFDSVYKLYDMLVWNYNGEFEWMLGFGFKDVTVEYTADGAEWTVLGDFTLAQGISAAGYAVNNTIAFNGVGAKAVRLTMNSAYGTHDQYGLSEVRFYHLPVAARVPAPADEATGVAFDTVLTWRAGREAVSHEVYVSTDEAAVADGTALVDTVSDPSLDLGEFDFSMMYYWKVNEVNEAEAVSTWEGKVWTFTTQAFSALDDFESYEDEDEAARIYNTWIDGLTTEDNGSLVGYDNEPFAERTIVNSGMQSMPLEYDNDGPFYYSEAYRTWSPAADLTAGGADTLTLYFYGSADNAAETLYVAVEDSTGKIAVVSHPDPAAVQNEAWQQWLISYADLAGVNLAKVETIYVGLGDRDNPSAGGTGRVFIDDIGFGTPLSHNLAGDVTGSGDAIQGVPNDGITTGNADNGWPEAETPNLAIDDDTATKFLHFKGEVEPTGFQVTPTVGATIVTEITLTTANDSPERDPVSFELYGSNESIDGPYTLIASGDIVDFAQETAWERYTKNATPITFDNDVAYTHYQVLFPAVRDAGSANSMQIGEVELIGTVAP